MAELKRLSQQLGGFAVAAVLEEPTGVFGAEMQVELVNDGPVTLVLDV